MRLWLFGCMVLICCILTGCAATSTPDAALTEGGAAAKQAEMPKVLVPFSEYEHLVKAQVLQEQGYAQPLLARADYSFAGNADIVELQAKLAVIGPDTTSQAFAPFSCPGAKIVDVSVMPLGAASVYMGTDGPIISLHKSGNVALDIRCQLKPKRGLVRFDTKPFSLATVSLPVNKGFVMNGGVASSLRDGKRTWMIQQPKEPGKNVSVEILFDPRGGAIDLTRPQIARVDTVLSVEGNELIYESVIEGVGLSEEGGAVELLLPLKSENVKVAGDGELIGHSLKAVGDKMRCRIELDRLATSPWHCSVRGRVDLASALVDLEFTPPAPLREKLPELGQPIRKTAWKGGLIAFSEVQPRRLTLGRQLAKLQADWWEVSETDTLEKFLETTQFEGKPRRLFEYKMRQPKLPIKIDEGQLRLQGLSRVITAVEAETKVEENNGGTDSLDNLVTTVTYKLSTGQGPFVFKMEQLHEDLQVTIDGTRKGIEADDKGKYVVELPNKKEATISVSYAAPSTPAAHSLGAFDLVLPSVNLHSLSTNWTVQLKSDHEPYEIDTTLVSPVEKPPFFLARLGLVVIEYLLAGGELAMEVVSTVYERIAGPLTAATQTAGQSETEKKSEKENDPSLTAKAQEFLSVAKEHVRPEAVKVILKAGFMPAPLTEESEKKSESIVVPQCPRAIIYSVSKTFSFPIWLSAFILGMVLFAYVWMWSNGVPPVEVKYAVPALTALLFLFDWAFPFAISGTACSFFFITGGLGAFRLTAYVEQTMRLAHMRQIALQEAGTIGDLEGQSVFFSTRKKRNIIHLSELFEEDEDDEDDGIMFFAPDSPKEEEGENNE